MSITMRASHACFGGTMGLYTHAETGARLTLRRHAGYDHTYWFIQTYVADHLAWHAARLK